MTNRWDEDWQAYRCSDCDPDHAGEDEPVTYDKPYVVLVPHGEVYPDDCPRCGSRLSMCEDANKLHIANTPAERWARRNA